MNRDVIAAIVRRDLLAMTRSASVMVPMVVVPAVVLLIAPITTYLITRADADALQIGQLLELIPSSIVDRTDTDSAALAVSMATYIFPTLMMVVPIMVVSVITSDSIAGERERGTLEGLLLTPATDTELFVAKMLSAATPAAIIHFASSALYCIVINVVLSSAIDGWVIPTAGWFGIVLWVAPAFATVTLAVSVVISARANSVQGASQLTGIAVLPLMMMVIGQVAGVALLSGWLSLAVGAVLWIAGGLTIGFGRRSLTRERLIARV